MSVSRVLAILLLGTGSAPLGAQERLPTMDCDQALHVLNQDGPGEHYGSALIVATGCGAAGQRALVQQWRSPPHADVDLGQLQTVTALSPDRALFQAAAGAVLDSRAGFRLRFHALGALVRRLDERTLLVLVDPPPAPHPDLTGESYVRRLRALPGPGQPGAIRRPLPAAELMPDTEARMELWTVLDRLAGQEPRELIGSIAAYLLQELFPSGASCTGALRQDLAALRGPQYAELLWRVSLCGRQGVEMVAGQWRSPPAGEFERLVLQSVSARTRDAKLFSVVRSTVLDEAVEEPIRFAALHVLVAYVDPRLSVELIDPAPASVRSLRDLVRVSRTFHRPGRGEPDPDPPPPDPLTGTEERVREVLSQLAGREAGGRIEIVASYLQAELFPSADPPSPGARQEYRYDCTAAMAAISEGVAGDAYVQALYELSGCGRRGIARLAAEWDHPPPGPTERGFLETVSARTPDRLVVSAVRDVALNSELPLWHRFHALAVLVRYVPRALPLLSADPLPTHRTPVGSDYVHLARSFGGPLRPGSVRPPGPAVDRVPEQAFPDLVRQVLVELSSEDGPMGLIAAYFLEEFFPKG